MDSVQYENTDELDVNLKGLVTLHIFYIRHSRERYQYKGIYVRSNKNELLKKFSTCYAIDRFRLHFWIKRHKFSVCWTTASYNKYIRWFEQIHWYGRFEQKVKSKFNRQKHNQ